MIGNLAIQRNDPRDIPLLVANQVLGGSAASRLFMDSRERRRLTEAQDTTKDPAFSPDCRMIAFASSRGGVYISNPQGLNQTRVISGAAETVRWSR